MVAVLMFSFVWRRFVTVNNTTGRLMGSGNQIMAIGLFSMLFIMIGIELRAFKVGVERISSIAASLVLTAFTTDFLEIFISSAIVGMGRYLTEFAVQYLILFIGHSIVLSFIVYGMVVVYRKLFPPYQMLEIYGTSSHNLGSKINGIWYKYHIVERVHYSTNEEIIRRKICEYDAVIINDIPAHEKNRMLKACLDLDKRVYFLPKISDVIVHSAEELNLIDTPLYFSRNIGIGVIQSGIKRVTDIVFSLCALILTSPILLITAIAIHAEDGGPVFFRQERCTLNERRFEILKFRSMIVDAEKDGRPHPAGVRDERITRIGRIIRPTRIDELPQLINILKGDMSLVGPRPERVEHVVRYTEMIPEFRFRHKVKGGLTGYAQVYGKYNTEALDKLKLDLMYIMNYSLLLDIQIIFETVKILFRKESTEGFSQENVREMHDAGVKR
jgi:exopolysaccharide biosynthesis polyprenyl glycosylphosphotransferase